MKTTRTLIAALSASLLALAALPASATVIDLSSLNRAGTATMVGNDLQLTVTGSSAGAGWLNQSISTSQSFSASFSFWLNNNNSSGKMADGIGLVFQNQGNSSSIIGKDAQDVGYWDINHSGSASVGSIIRTWRNNAIGLSTNGEVQSVQAADWNLGAAKNITGTETVSYDATTHVLTMSGTFYDNSNSITVAHTVSDSKVVDLGAKFGSAMYLGFTGGTGGTMADQRITGFSLSVVPEPESYAMMLAGLGLIGVVARRRRQAR